MLRQQKLKGFSGSIEALKDTFLKKWWECGANVPAYGRVYDKKKKIMNQKEFDLFIKEMRKRLDTAPEDPAEKDVWRQELGKFAEKSAKRIFGLSDQYINFFILNNFVESTKKFVNDAKEFNVSMRIEDIMQAIRNVWIYNSIQVLMGKKVDCNPAIFAYSMLYPYTDNYIDDPVIPDEAKLNTSMKLGKWLKGEGVEASNEHEAAIYKLVKMIEKIYPRLDYEDVYNSLLAIHAAQQSSLYQQKGSVLPYEADIMGISFVKGGTSVLTDGYLVDGRLTANEAAFMFGFGVVLQLADDLQDITSDMRNGHMTVFSQLAGKWPLDLITARFLSFMKEVIDVADLLETPQVKTFKDVLLYNCRFLVYEAASRHQKFFTKGFVKNLEKYSPFTFTYLRKLNRRITKEYLSFKKHSDMTEEELIPTYLI